MNLPVIAYKKITPFILFSFLISWGCALLIHLSGIKADSFGSVALIACIYMEAPLISVFIVQRVIYKEPFLKYGLSFKGNTYKWMLHIPLYFLLFITIYILLCLIFGNALSVKGFGYIDFSYTGFLNTIRSLSKSGEKIPMPSDLPQITGFILFSVGLLFATIFSGFVNLLFTLGEEYGWRGLLYEELKHMGKIRTNIITGCVWGVWHAPLIIWEGLNYPSYPYLGIVFMVLFCIAVSFLFSALKEKYNTVFAPAMFHGIINGAAGIFLYFQHNSNELIGNVTGVAGIAAIFITYLILKGFLYKLPTAKVTIN